MNAQVVATKAQIVDVQNQIVKAEENIRISEEHIKNLKEMLKMERNYVNKRWMAHRRNLNAICHTSHVDRAKKTQEMMLDDIVILSAANAAVVKLKQGS